MKEKTNKTWNNNVLETRAWFFLARKETQMDENVGGVLLGDNTGGVAVMRRSIGFRFQLDPLWHTHTHTHLPSWTCVHCEPTCAKFDFHRIIRDVNCCLSGGVSIFLPTEPRSVQRSVCRHSGSHLRQQIRTSYRLHFLHGVAWTHRFHSDVKAMYVGIRLHPLHLMSVEWIRVQEVGVGHVAWRTNHTFCCVDDTLWKAFPGTVALRRRISGAVVHQALADDVAVSSYAINCHVFRIFERDSPATKLSFRLRPAC